MMDQDALDEISKHFKEAMDNIEKAQEEMWSKLTEEQQLAAFCCVVRRICKGEYEENGSYRHILYDTFGFGPEAYAQAQVAGYLQLHDDLGELGELRKFVAAALKNTKE